MQQCRVAKARELTQFKRSCSEQPLRERRHSRAVTREKAALERASKIKADKQAKIQHQRELFIQRKENAILTKQQKQVLKKQKHDEKMDLARGRREVVLVERVERAKRSGQRRSASVQPKQTESLL